jgi:hypothetical protein
MARGAKPPHHSPDRSTASNVCSSAGFQRPLTTHCGHSRDQAQRLLSDRARALRSIALD